MRLSWGWLETSSLVKYGSIVKFLCTEERFWFSEKGGHMAIFIFLSVPRIE